MSANIVGSSQSNFRLIGLSSRDRRSCCGHKQHVAVLDAALVQTAL
jgi:hypothetical protein